MEQQKKAEAYRQLVMKRMPRRKTWPMCFKAFFVGGCICCVGQLIRDFAEHSLLLDDSGASTFTSIV